ncbi:glycosyltransferase family 25 [Akanthomyces lecanii RCEF 1005]|uniref:Glycosyltransferase family 25 n=1 Tax=Akanthomyces lecanii RCEF 1005 TaxID=1081108 RepID=A0A167ZPH4_CORDF|nr:glycosyltransferase family 25 [Akanthomyces lecanii RCEF 1005]
MAALYALTWIASLRFSFGPTQLHHVGFKNLQGASNRDDDRIKNRTLGFEKIIAIGLPERSDKRDALSLMASLSNVDIDWVDGVKMSAMSAKSAPFGINFTAMEDNFLASWRSHMNAIRQIVESGVSSALIMEDDMDWDAHVKTQLTGVAHGVHHVLNEQSGRLHSPYGDTWDLLWLGHCGEPFPETLEENAGLDDEAKEKMSSKYLIHDDWTVPPYENVSHLVDWTAFPAGTRVIHRTAAPICSFAYAITQRAARKILYSLSVDGLHMAFDNSLAQLCRDSAYDMGRDTDTSYKLQCVSVNPTIMFHHRPKGSVTGDSDIQSYGGDGSMRDQGYTEAVKWSMRLNLKNMLLGKALEPQMGPGLEDQ